MSPSETSLAIERSLGLVFHGVFLLPGYYDYLELRRLDGWWVIPEDGDPNQWFAVDSNNEMGDDAMQALGR